MGLLSSLAAWGSASWNRLPTSCGVRRAELAGLPALFTAQPAPQPSNRGGPAWQAQPTV